MLDMKISEVLKGAIMTMSKILQLILDNYPSLIIFLLMLVLITLLWKCRAVLKELFFALNSDKLMLPVDRLMLLVVFILILVFLIYPWPPQKTDTYLVLGLFSILTIIPLLSILFKFNIIKIRDVEFRGPRLDIRQADPKEVEEDKKKEEVVEEDKGKEGASRNHGDDQRFKDARRRRAERAEIENKVLDSFSSKNNFQKHAMLQLDEDADPIADVGRIIFDGFYRNWRRHYFIKIFFSGPMYMAGRERLYRDIRVMKDLTDGTPYRKYILKIAYIKLDGEETDRGLVGLKFLKNYFGKAIRDEYLEIEVFNENGEEINA